MQTVDSNVQLGQFAALPVDICAWRMAVYMTLAGRKGVRQVPVPWWKTAADTILVPVALFLHWFKSQNHQPEGKSAICTTEGNEGTQNHEVGIKEMRLTEVRYQRHLLFCITFIYFWKVCIRYFFPNPECKDLKKA